MRRRSDLSVFAATAAILSLPTVAVGQGRGGAQGAGVSSIGAAGTGGSFGQIGAAGSSFGSSAGGQSAFGSSFGQSSATIGGNRFSSANPGSGIEPAFIGRAGGLDLQNLFGASSGRSGGRARSGRSEANPSGQRRPPAPVRLRVDPALAAALGNGGRSSDEAVENAMRLIRRKGLDGVVASAGGDAVRLEGSVATDHDRLVAEKLMAIEPGVRDIENLLKVLPKISETLPAPR